MRALSHRIVAATLVIIASGFARLAIAAQPDSLKHYLGKAEELARQWNSDSELVRAGGNSNISLDGSVRCQETSPPTGWIFTFRSPAKDQYFRVSACKANVSSGPIGKGFPRPPNPIHATFIDTDRVGEICRTVARKWGYSNCYMVAGIRASGEEKVVDKDFPKGIPLWDSSLYCDQDQGGFIFIDGRNGRVLKSYESPTKGD